LELETIGSKQKTLGSEQ